MTTSQTPLLPPAAAADAVLAEADALLSTQRMGDRARLLLARAAQMQALHGQALQVVRAQPGTLPPALTPPGASVQDVMIQSAAQAVVATHHQLVAAAAQAHQLAAKDPLLARLQAAIDGCPPAPQVIDVQATEVQPSRARASKATEITDVTDLTDVDDAGGPASTPATAPPDA